MLGVTRVTSHDSKVYNAVRPSELLKRRERKGLWGNGDTTTWRRERNERRKQTLRGEAEERKAVGRNIGGDGGSN